VFENQLAEHSIIPITTAHQRARIRPDSGHYRQPTFTSVYCLRGHGRQEHYYLL